MTIATTNRIADPAHDGDDPARGATATRDELLELARAIRDDLLDQLRSQIRAEIDEARADLSMQLGKLLEKHAATADEAVAQRLAAVAAELRAEVAAAERRQDQRAGLLEETFRGRVEQVARLVGALRDLPAPVVNLSVPADAIRVDVEQQAPEIRVEVPPARLVEKSFTYLPDGRPDRVIEREIDPNPNGDS